MKKFIKDQVFESRAEALAAITDAMTNSAAVHIDPNAFWDMLHDNIPGVTDESGELVATFGPDAEGLPAFDEAAETGQLALVTVWSGQPIDQAEGEPLDTPKGIYLLSLPKLEEIVADVKLRPYLSQLLKRDALAKARKMAKQHAEDPAGAPLSRDRIAAMVAAAASRAGNPNATAFKALFPVLQGVLLAVVDKKVTALKEAKQHAPARALAATFSRARLNAKTLEECLSSAEAAKFHFPSMAQPQWENLLRFAVAQAPKHTVRKPEKDEQGKSVKGEDGKVIYSAPIPAPVSPVPFQAWLETRHETIRSTDDAPSVDLSDILG